LLLSTRFWLNVNIVRDAEAAAAGAIVGATLGAVIGAADGATLGAAVGPAGGAIVVAAVGATGSAATGFLTARLLIAASDCRTS
jgi:hypothetical protein